MIVWSKSWTPISRLNVTEERSLNCVLRVLRSRAVLPQILMWPWANGSPLWFSELLLMTWGQQENSSPNSLPALTGEMSSLRIGWFSLPASDWPCTPWTSSTRTFSAQRTESAQYLSAQMVLLLSALTSIFTWNLLNEQGPHYLPDLLCYCCPLVSPFQPYWALYGSLTRRHAPGSGLLPLPETLSPQIPVKIYPFSFWSLFKWYLINKAFSPASICTPCITTPLLFPYFIFTTSVIMLWHAVYFTCVFEICCLSLHNGMLALERGFGHCCWVLHPSHLEPGLKHCTIPEGTLHVEYNVDYDVVVLPETVPGT